MTNKEIARSFQLLGRIMELHGENPYKIRSYQNAYINLRKLGRPLADMAPEDVEGIKGVGKAISAKIQELLSTGQMQTLEKYRSITPPGVQELLNIKGFGPKKIKVVWDKLGVESPGELLYAVNENRLLDLKGFGPKTQADLKTKLEYYLRARDQFHFATVDREAELLLAELRAALPGVRIERSGALRRAANVLDRLDLLVGHANPSAGALEQAGLEKVEPIDGGFHARSASGLPVRLVTTTPEAFAGTWFEETGSSNFLQAFHEAFPKVEPQRRAEEAEIFRAAGLHPIPPELRETDWAIDRAKSQPFDELVTPEAVRGVVHTHTTASDGVDSLRDMALYARDQGYGYLVISDHSRSAFYANGLSAERLIEQGEAIDALRDELAPFRLFKSVESDILADGSLDYPDEVLETLDLVIASVHANLRMDETKATERLLRAIENPYTRILGHPTGRLLLSRPGYPIDHAAVIDACAEHEVAIELNANPWRLDLDWSWIPYAMERGVMISINPDAHSREGIHDIAYGVISARKGGLTTGACLNHLEADAFESWCRNRRK